MTGVSFAAGTVGRRLLLRVLLPGRRRQGREGVEHKCITYAGRTRS